MEADGSDCPHVEGGSADREGGGGVKRKRKRGRQSMGKETDGRLGEEECMHGRVALPR